jgi:hypothetical protein
VHSGLPGLTYLVENGVPKEEGGKRQDGLVTVEESRKQAGRAIQKALADARYWDVGLMVSFLILGIAIGASCSGLLSDFVTWCMLE